MAAIARVPDVTSHSLQHQQKTESFAIRGIFFRCKYNLEVDIIDQYNYISHFYYTGNAEISVIWNAIPEFFIKKLI